MSIECKYQDIQNNLDQICEYVTNNCSYAFFNFYKLHYCYFQSYIWISIIIFCLIGSVCFYMLSDTSNRYLSTSLTLLSDKFKMSQNLAGLTLLAFGNGAADVISSIVASEGENGGIDFSISALMGAGVFVTSFVLSTVIFISQEVKVNHLKFSRDILLYLITIGILTLFSFDGVIKLWESILFFSIYLIYVLIAIIQDRFTNKIIIVDSEDEENMAEDIINDFKIYDFENVKNAENTVKVDSNNLLDDSMSQYKNNQINDKSADISNQIETIRHDHFYENQIDLNISHSVNIKKKNNFNHTIRKQYTTLNYRIKKLYFSHPETKYYEKGFLGKFFYCAIEFPFSILRDLTIPPCEVSKWNRAIFVFMPIFIFFFVVYTTDTFAFFKENYYYLMVLGGLYFIWVLITIWMTYRNRLPGCEMLLAIGSFIMSIFWIWFISNILVDILKIFGVLLNVPESFLGMTLLAFGNSLPDFSVNCALARAGYGEMALAGSIAGPLFNLLIGLGFSLIKKNINQ